MEKKEGNTARVAAFFVWQKTEDDFFNCIFFTFYFISLNLLRRCIYYFCNYKNIKE